MEKSHIEEIKQINKEKLEKLEKINREKLEKLEQLEKEQFELDKVHIVAVEKILQRVAENINECTICADNPADTAVIPCGHKYFCKDCIEEWQRLYPRKGCPICKGDILCVAKIFA